MLSEEQSLFYKQFGYVVVENVLSEDDVEEARSNLHKDIRNRTGIMHGSAEWTEGNKIGARLKGPGNNMYYGKWKFLNIHLKPSVVECYTSLLRETCGPGNVAGFEHPFGRCNEALCFADRVAYRLPDAINDEGGLALHLDRNPLDPYLLQAGGLDKWRPIQSFVALTDHFGKNSGGLMVAPGSHNIVDEYFADNEEAKEAVGRRGEFFRMHSKKHSKMNNQLQVVYAPKGSLVMWDNRLAHGTCEKLSGFDSREVVYTGFLPNTEINRSYIDHQLRAIRNNVYPMYGPQGYLADRDWNESELTMQQRKLLGIP